MNKAISTKNRLTMCKWCAVVLCAGCIDVRSPSGQFAAMENPDDLSNFTATSKTPDGKLITALRPLVREISPREPLTAVLHWSQPDGPFSQTGVEGPTIDLTKSLASTTFTIATADGRIHALKATFEDHRAEYWRPPQPAYRVATLLLTLDPQGVHVKTMYGELVGKWEKKLPLDFSKSGDYALAISGELVGAETTFVTAPIKFQIAMGAIPIAEAKKKAEAAIAKHLPEGKMPNNQQTESGFVPGMVYTDATGRRVLHYNVQIGKGSWSYDLVRVKQDRTGEIVEIAYRNVHTCVAEGTIVETPSGPQPVELLREGDEVLAYDVERGVKSSTRVVTMRTLTAPLILQFGKLRLTGNHTVYTSTGWLSARELNAKSQVLGVDGYLFAIGGGARIESETKVFDLAVGPPHTYFAGGILVHNKDRGWSADLDDPWYFYWGDKPHGWKKVTSDKERRMAR